MVFSMEASVCVRARVRLFASAFVLGASLYVRFNFFWLPLTVHTGASMRYGVRGALGSI